ncbi:uncharacterized protein LOC131957037 isoform X2 [Physella acuta]|uniref:uncharacterized protein LOC131957037 isoform X2 n=1 Tax=Physella acuta TaxID=109671 RepID=UPI0027DDFB7F|nr:uncharacterized protein LOC131957037 isoform X2 [Physella acuta]
MSFSKVYTLFITEILVLVSFIAPASLTTCESHYLMLTSNTYGTLTSPDYPKLYSPNFCTQWTLFGLPGMKVAIRIWDLDLPTYHDFCDYDSLLISAGSVFEKRLCGDKVGKIFSPYLIVLDQQASLNIILNSTIYGPKGRGFNISYDTSSSGYSEAVKEQSVTSTHTPIPIPWMNEIDNEKTCLYIQEGNSGLITLSPTIKYALSKRPYCSWYIFNNVDATYKIQILTHSLTDGDSLKVYEGRDEYSRCLGSCNVVYCNALLYTPKSEFFIKLKVKNSAIPRNFTLKYSTLSANSINMGQTSSTLMPYWSKSESSLPEPLLPSVNCLPGYQPCGFNELACYPVSNRCDGVWHCPLHGGDERGCYDCDVDQFSCNTTSHFCYREIDRCNGKGTCANYIDETGCTPQQCSSEKGLFLCDNGRCIYEKWRCDRTSDCTDNSDEEDCPTLSSPRVIVAAVVGSLVCSLLLVVALGCVCKVYNIRMHNLRAGTRHETPLTRQLAEMFHHRAPPPPYHEAMLTSRPYDEAYLELLSQDESPSLLIDLNNVEQNNLNAVPQRSPREHGGRRCRHGRRHREVNQIIGSSYRERSEPQGLIEIGSLPLLTEAIDALPLLEEANAYISLSEPPPYFESGTSPLVEGRMAESSSDSDDESSEEENWQPSFVSPLESGDTQHSTGCEAVVQVGTSAPVPATQVRTGGEELSDEGGKDMETTSTSFSVDSSSDLAREGQDEDKKIEDSVIHEDSDSDCILNEECGPDEDDTDSDSACLLRHT